jgi:hypothetical protein
VRDGQRGDQRRHHRDHRARKAAPGEQDQAHRGERRRRAGRQVAVPAHAQPAGQAEQRYAQRDRGIASHGRADRRTRPAAPVGHLAGLSRN